METEVMTPSPAVDFNFDIGCGGSPYITAPSSPQRCANFFFSSPSSPTRALALYGEFNNFSCYENPIVATQHGDEEGCDTDFEFDFSGQLETTSLHADELFDGGKIKPLKPHGTAVICSPKSPRSPKKMIKKAMSRRKDSDSFAAAIEGKKKETVGERRSFDQRGRESIYNPTTKHIGTRSLSPFRISNFWSEQEENNQQDSKNFSSSSSSSSSSWFLCWYRKWKLKDIFLFRSASEGRATTSKDPLRKYTVLRNNQHQEDVNNWSFRSTDSVGSVSRRRGPPVSAHELHYTTNRAMSEEMRRKTFLPYKQGLLGCLGFNPALPEVSRRLNSFSRG